jgi:prophage antirepressor-like protein
MSDQKIVPFIFEGESLIRVVEMDSQPWFVAADVCRVLGIDKHRDAVARLDDDERGSVEVDTPGGRQAVAAISEGGLYTLILRSRQATTPGTVQHRFRKWVTAEVLPAIRKTGAYAGPGAAPSDRPPMDLPWVEKAPSDRRLEIDTARLLAAVAGAERALFYIDNIAKIPGAQLPGKRRQPTMNFDPDAEEEIVVFRDPKEQNGGGTH